MSVHARGTIRFLEGAVLEDMLRQTSLHFEAYDRESPTIYDNLPAELTQRLVKRIVAFEITVADLDNVFKLSQDRDAPSYIRFVSQRSGKPYSAGFRTNTLEPVAAQIIEQWKINEDQNERPAFRLR